MTRRRNHSNWKAIPQTFSIEFVKNLQARPRPTPLVRGSAVRSRTHGTPDRWTSLKMTVVFRLGIYGGWRHQQGYLQEAQLSLRNRASTLSVESGKMLHAVECGKMFDGLHLKRSVTGECPSRSFKVTDTAWCHSIGHIWFPMSSIESMPLSCIIFEILTLRPYLRKV